MHALLRIIVLSLGVSLLWACTDEAQESKEANVAPGKSEQTAANEALSLLQMSAQLAQLAVADEDAAMLAQAAKLRARVATEALEAEATQGESEQTGTESEKETSFEHMSAADMLELAREFAGDDETLLALIDGTLVAEVRSRGMVGGARTIQDVVGAYSEVFYRNVYFEGGAPAEVLLIGDGDTDLDLIIYDEFGNVICASESMSDREYCAWQPRWTGAFTIEVSNFGSVWNAYILATN
ncbi:hypothetical protein K8B33_11575 [Alcanivorax sp. JB21]|uniref:hypothetical protein n=1 Tax=Alcanivorax limicola TaxID=2874102 RepID=UPI001CBE0390|nr:hypothetical protein [Alcanivorax limicola]MBZ2189740.1 hypothetical protein [Alcanivorax limicola]